MNAWQRFLYARSGWLAREVADLLVRDPRGWTNADGYWLKHDEAKLEIWISNAGYGLSLQVWPIEPGFPARVSPRWVERMLLWSLVKPRHELTAEQMMSVRAAEVIRQRRTAA